eukprot:1159904-Pelagomonas_calceolata.AAC.6
MQNLMPQLAAYPHAPLGPHVETHATVGHFAKLMLQLAVLQSFLHACSVATCKTLVYFQMQKLMPQLAACPAEARPPYTRVISHRMHLREGVEGYRLFNNREAIKVVLSCA